VLAEAGTPIAPSTYYAHKTRLPSQRSVTDAETLSEIERVHKENYGVYGIRKVWAQLGREGGVGGRSVARCTVARLMKVAGLRGISRVKTPRTTRSAAGPDTRPDLVKRAFTAAAPNQLWVADITYVKTHSGWVYAAFVLDVFSRRIVGWQLARNLYTDLALDALNMGIWTRQRAGADLTDLIHHSDRGVQGGFQGSSQHLDRGGVFYGVTRNGAVGGPSAAGCGSSGPLSDAVSGPATAATTCRARVLGSDRPGRVERGRRCGGRRVDAGRVEVVPSRWRHVTDQLDRAVGPLPVLR
jgi:putative transposase